MKSMTMKILVFGLVILGGVATAGEMIEVTASVDRQSAYIGDLLSYDVVITYDSSVQITPPAIGVNLGGFDVKDYKVSEERTLEDGRKQQELNFVMRTFTTGEYVIPPMPIEYMLPDSTKKVVASDPLKIEIKSLLAEGEAADTVQLRPLKGQISLARDRTGLILAIIAGVVIIAAVIIYLVLGRRRRRPEEEFIDPRPAWEIAFADLAVLKEKDLIAKGEIKRFYFELSDIFRRYLGKKFDFNAIDLTTEEIEDYFGDSTMKEESAAEIVEFLDATDLVKFAKYIPPEGQPLLDWEWAYRLVKATREVFIGPGSEPELIAETVPQDAVDEEFDDPELKYVPPELREQVASRKKEDAS